MLRPSPSGEGITDDGWKSGNPKLTERFSEKLAKVQRKLAKKQKGSKNREKAKRKVARIHAKIADSRKDFTHKLSAKLISENDLLALESLQVRNMIRNHSLSKAIADCNWEELERQIEYKGQWCGREVVKIDKFFPSSKRCSVTDCGHILSSLDLNKRKWTCPKCGTVHDRDTNAAKNILSAGLAKLAGCENLRSD